MCVCMGTVTPFACVQAIGRKIVATIQGAEVTIEFFDAQLVDNGSVLIQVSGAMRKQVS